MMVNSPLEIYSAVIGAHLYDQIFNILAATGLAFLPILSLFFHYMTKPYEQGLSQGAEVSLKSVGIQFFLMVFFIMIFVAPTHKLDVNAVTYQPVCAKNAQISKFGSTGTTYDHVFSDLEYENIRIPLGLALVLNGSSGITNAAIVSLPCKTDVQKIASVVDTTRLTPELTQSVERFYDECYAKAKSNFMDNSPDKSSYRELLDDYGGQSDLSWIGSHVFQQLYYNKLYPSDPVSPFPYSSYPYQYQDFNQKSGVATPKYGFPNCETWWTDSTYGLRQQLLQLVRNHQSKNPHLGEIPLTDQLESWLAKVKQYTSVGSKVTAQDVLVRGLLQDFFHNGGFSRFSTGWMNSSDQQYGADIPKDIGVAGNQLFAVGGQYVHSIFAKIDRREVDQEIPILQAVLMALCLALGPLILILGRYQISVIFSYYFILASIISITFIEKLIHYLELSLYASQSYGVGAFVNSSIMYNIFTKLYFAAPLIYLMLMSICGVMVGNALRDSFAGDVSGRGGSLGKTVTTTAMSAL